MLKEYPSPLDIEGQIENLCSLGLEFENIDFARRTLNDISYFRLIKAYGLGLKPQNGQYQKGTTFEQIVDLYLFNSNFRQLLFSAIERVEINLRCRIANHFSITYGCFGYESGENFVNPFYHKQFMLDIDEEIGRNSRSPFVKNFRLNYEEGKIPFYALIELFSFGELSKFYKNMKAPDKKLIAVSFGVGYKFLESWFESLAYVRNICAHYGRLYNAKLVKAPALYSQYASVHNNRPFSVLIVLKYLLGRDSKAFSEIAMGVNDLLDKHKHVVLQRMGFPNNWREILEIVPQAASV